MGHVFFQLQIRILFYFCSLEIMTYDVRLRCTQIFLNVGDQFFPILIAIKCFYIHYLIDESTLMNKKVYFIKKKTEGQKVKLFWWSSNSRNRNMNLSSASHFKLRNWFIKTKLPTHEGSHHPRTSLILSFNDSWAFFSSKGRVNSSLSSSTGKLLTKPCLSLNMCPQRCT